MLLKKKYIITKERNDIKHMTYEQFIRNIQLGREYEIKIDMYNISIFNQGQDDELFPEESVFIYKTKDTKKDIYVNKNKLETFLIYNNKTIKELWNTNEIKIVQIYS